MIDTILVFLVLYIGKNYFKVFFLSLLSKDANYFLFLSHDYYIYI